MKRANVQVTFLTLGGKVVTYGDEIQPLRGKHYVQPRGYAAPPGSGPEGETCRSCKHRRINRMRSGKTFPKCALFTKPTGGRASDILVSAPACRLWEREDHQQ